MIELISKGDVAQILNKWHGRKLTITPRTQSFDNDTGEQVFVNGTSKLITAFFVRSNQKWDYEKAGFFEKGDAFLVCLFKEGVKKDDLIVAEGLKFVVKEVLNVPSVLDPDGSNTEFIFTSCNLFLYSQ